MRDGKPLVIQLKESNLTIKTEDMTVAGDMIQDPCSYLNISNAEAVADFPQEMEEFRRVLLKVDEFNATRLKLAAETADSSNAIKTMLIKAEDARLLNNMTNMKKMYGELRAMNRDLISEHTKRATNHQDLLAALKVRYHY